MAHSHLSSPPLLLDKWGAKWSPWSWADRAARGSEAAAQRDQRDLGTALAQIDGLMAGFQYLDETESPISRASTPYTYPRYFHFPELDIDESSSQATGSFAAAMAAGSPTSEHKPMASQWAAIRTLRGETEFHHKEFQTLAKGSDNPVICSIGQEFPNARLVRKKGMVIFRDVLNGYKPSRLKEIFALTSLSYAISQLLLKGKRIQKQEILADLKHWRDAIVDDDERQAFSCIAQQLWPESREHLHFIPVSQRNPSREVSVDWLPGGDALGANRFNSLSHGVSFENPAPYPSFSEYDNDLVATQMNAMHGPADANQLHLPYHFQERLANGIYEEVDLSRIPDDVLTHLSTAHDPSTFRPPEAPVPQGPPDQTQPLPDTYSGFMTDQQDKPTPSGAGTEAKHLHDTMVFIVILIFFKEVSDVLQILSGRSLISRLAMPYTSQQDDQKEFIELARETFFTPRRQPKSCPSPAFSALISVAETFTESGLLRSFNDVRHYLATAAAVSKSGSLEGTR